VTTFVLVRHGLTDAVGTRLTGLQDGIVLNEAGRAQVQRTAQILRAQKLNAVISSPLERARDTAAAIADPHGLTVEVDPGLGEFDVGFWTGVTIADLSADPHWRQFNMLRSETRAPAGELMLDVQQRVVTRLLALRDRFSAGRVVVVSHGDVIRAALQYFLGMPMDFVHRLDVDPARISVVAMTEGGPVVRMVNGMDADI
jgi:probable phosphoglycerate mutase